MKSAYFRQLTFLLCTLLFLAACTPEASPAELCNPSTQGILLLPTKESRADPNLALENPADYVYDHDNCGQVVSAGEETPRNRALTVGDIKNVTLDIDNANLESTASNRHMTAVAWTIEDSIYVGISRGGAAFEMKQVDNGRNPHLAISDVSRLHLVYEQEGIIYARTSDADEHPADIAPTFVAYGSNPAVAIDLSSYSHVIHNQFTNLTHLMYWGPDNWLPLSIPYSANTNLASTGDTFLLALAEDNQISAHQFVFNLVPVYQWTQRGSWPISGELVGDVNIAFHKPPTVVNYEDYDGTEPYWYYLSWVERTPGVPTNEIDALMPAYEVVNPLAPEQLANPDQIYAGLNATRWHSDDNPYDAGFRQTVSVKGSVTITAQAKALADDGAHLQLRLGLDPTGGTDPDSPNVQWSDTVVNPADFTQLAVSASANGSATLFLRATQDVAGVAAVAIWDDIQISGGGGILNPGFEEGFETQGTLDNIPNGWTPFFDDFYASGIDSAAVQRDLYTVYAAWSADRGVTWSEKTEIVTNEDPAAGITGAFGPSVFPAINTDTDPDTVTFFYVYESGDPPANTDFLRYGRPYAVQCDIGGDSCSDGQPLFSRNAIRPTIRLHVAQTPGDDAVTLVWDALQADYENKDIYAALVSLSE
jgi:hypothetical protein